MQVVEVPYIDGGTPARVNRKTGVIYLNKAVFDKYSPIYKAFVLAHEEAHYIFQTKDEEMCDSYAMYKLLKKGHKPKEIVDVLLKTLSNSKLHYSRKLNLINDMRIYDYVVNGNKSALNPL